LNNLPQNQMKLIIDRPKIDGFVVSAKPLKRLLQSVMPLILLANYPAQVYPQVAPPVKKVVPKTQNPLAKLKFPRNGTPIGRRQGGARRTGTQCPDLKTPITALVPGEETADESKSFLAFTVSEYPTFWVYVPQLPANLRGEFVFQDEKGVDIYRTPLTLPEKSGAIGISLPQSPQYALKTNNKYQWYFFVYCGDTPKESLRERSNTSEYFSVNAWVERVALTSQLESQLKTAKPGEYTVYAVNYIWQDAVTNLAQMRQINSDLGKTTPTLREAKATEYRVLSDDWTNLLTSVGLSEFASAPIVGHVVEAVDK
jgi:hypothetical protein